VERCTSASGLALAFLRNDAVVDSVIQAASIPNSKYDGYSTSFTGRTSGLYLTARYELFDLTQRLLVSEHGDSNAEVDPKDGISRTPLSYAAESGHEAVVKLLLGSGANVNVQNGPYGNALDAASHRGHEALPPSFSAVFLDLKVPSGLDRQHTLSTRGPKVF